jgi:hypothetical protein
MAQQNVADLFGLGIDGKRTASDNFSSENGVLMHYRTIEAIRLADGTVIKNRECWSRGFAHCSTPSHNVKCYMNLTSIANAIGRFNLSEIKIIEDDDDSNSIVFSHEDRYFLDGGSFVVELMEPCQSVKEAYESMKPITVKKAELEGLEVKRQGEIFFIPIEDKIIVTNIRKMEHLELTQEGNPNRRIDHNHTATRQGTINGLLVAKGIIRHRWGDHRNLKLGDTWHLVLINTIKASFNRQGRGAD